MSNGLGRDRIESKVTDLCLDLRKPRACGGVFNDSDYNDCDYKQTLCRNEKKGTNQHYQGAAAQI